MGKEQENALEPEVTETKPEPPLAESGGKPKGSEPEKKDEGDKTKQDEAAKHKQMADQERANARRAREALEEAQAEKEQLAEELGTVRGEMAKVQSQLKELLTTQEYKGLANLDPETTDVPDLVKAFQAATGKLRNLEQDNAEMKAFIEAQKQQQRTNQVTNAHRQMEEEIYSACDEEFGAPYRNEAIRRSDEMVTQGEVAQPTTPVQGLLLMRKAYAEVVAKHKAPETKKKTVPTDTGLRGLSVAELEDSEEFKPGPLNQVKADMVKKMKAGTWKPQAFAAPS